MKAKILAYALLALILATLPLAEAQQPKIVPRIGYLSTRSPGSPSTIRVDALFVVPDPLVNRHREKITDLAGKSNLPAMYSDFRFIEVGGLMSYGPNFDNLSRRAAYFVDKILRGTNPADLPVERPMKLELVINLKTAKQIGVMIPPEVL